VVEAAQTIATVAAGLFAGAAIYVNVAEHPARLECGVAVAATVFGPSYRRAAAMQALLAVAGSVVGAGAWQLGAGIGWLCGAALLFFVVPFTLLVIKRTNTRLLDPALDRTSAGTHRLLVKWGRLHAVRSAAGGAAFVTFVLSLR
jgi:Domain of unknown function (DUF1772)